MIKTLLSCIGLATVIAVSLHAVVAYVHPPTPVLATPAQVDHYLDFSQRRDAWMTRCARYADRGAPTPGDPAVRRDCIAEGDSLAAEANAQAVELHQRATEGR